MNIPEEKMKKERNAHDREGLLPLIHNYAVVKEPYLKSNMQPSSAFVIRNNNRTLVDIFFTDKWFYSENPKIPSMMCFGSKRLLNQERKTQVYAYTTIMHTSTQKVKTMSQI